MDARMETKEEFRNAMGFRKARAPLELTFARELKATAMNPLEQLKKKQRQCVATAEFRKSRGE